MQVFDSHSKIILCQKALVMGFGVTGKAVVEFLLNKTEVSIYIASTGHVENWQGKPNDRITYFDINDTELLKQTFRDCDFVMRSPGIDPRGFPDLALKNKEIGEIELAYQFLRSNFKNGDYPKIIAVTGTNGKTTTVSLLNHVLKKSNIRSFLGGNIGTPFITLFENESWNKVEVIVLELSSFQTEQLKSFQADSAAILNLSSSHEERYHNADKYFQAKLNLINHVSIDKFFYLKENQQIIEKLNNMIQLNELNGISLNIENKLKTNFMKHLNLIGDHNLLNATFCHYMMRSIGLPVNGQNFSDFHGVPYRLQKVSCSSQRVLFNDAKSTNQDASLIALNSMLSKFTEFHFILGGQLRFEEINFDRLFEKMNKNIRLYFFGESQNELKRHAEKWNFSYTVCHNLVEIIDILKKDNLPVLFSPGFPSFDQYDNYIKRGEHFDLLAESL